MVFLLFEIEFEFVLFLVANCQKYILDRPRLGNSYKMRLKKPKCGAVFLFSFSLLPPNMEQLSFAIGIIVIKYPFFILQVRPQLLLWNQNLNQVRNQLILGLYFSPHDILATLGILFIYFFESLLVLVCEMGD